MFTQPPRGDFGRKIGARPLTTKQIFLYKAFKPINTPCHLRHRLFQPRQAIHSNFWPKRNLFGSFIPLFPWEQVDNGREENCSLFETFSSQFLEKMLKRGFLTKTGITKLPRIKRFAFATRLPGKWPSVRFAIQRTNKNSKLVAISR